MKFSTTFVAVVFASTSTLFGGSFTVDFQGPGGTTAAGTAAFESANQSLPDPAGITYTVADQQAAGSSDVGSDITITLGAMNLPDGAPDFRAVARNGAADETVNDWIGTDSRNGGTDVTLQVTVDGLAAGDYSWLSTHHDGGSGVTNGNQRAPAVLTFTSAGPVVTTTGFAHSEGNGGNVEYSQFSTDFTSDGSAVSLSIAVNDTGIADFAYINDLTISQVPEPSSLLLGLGSLSGLVLLRRRK